LGVSDGGSDVSPHSDPYDDLDQADLPPEDENWDFYQEHDPPGDWYAR
jgi:hypothetical protein